MEKEKLEFGDLPLNNYLTEQIPREEASRLEESIKSKIGQIKRQTLPSEEKVLELLERRQDNLSLDREYRRLDPSFLSLSNPVDFN